MAYRQLERPRREPNRSAQKLNTPAEFWITNGSTFDLALPCWYHEVREPIRARHHCRDWHDHVGQPTPQHPDSVCQDHDLASEWWHHGHYPHPLGVHPRYGTMPMEDITGPHRHAANRIDMARLIPIHLTAEGYDRARVAFDPRIEGLSAKAWVDEEDDWVIRVHFEAFVTLEDFEPKSTRFTIRLDDTKDDVTDVAVIARITIMPAAR